MSERDDSRELTGDETTELITVSEIIMRYKTESIGLITGDRYTTVYGWGTEGSERRKVFFDCYGQAIDSGANGMDRYNVVVRAAD